MCHFLTFFGLFAILFYQVLGIDEKFTDVPFTLRHIAEHAKFISFKTSSEAFHLILTFSHTVTNAEVFVIDDTSELSYKTGLHNNRDCKSYKGNTRSSGYSAVLCDSKLEKGVIIRENDYFIFQRSERNDTLIDIAHFNRSFDKDNSFKAINIPERYHKESHHNSTRDKRDFSGILDLTVEVVVMSEHLIYKEYCLLYSALDPNCTQGIEKLNMYIETLILGADTFYENLHNPQLIINIKLASIIHNARQTDGLTKEPVSVFHSVQSFSSTGEPQVDCEKGLLLFSKYQRGLLFKDPSRYNADVVVLLSQHSLTDDDDDSFRTIGLTFVGGVCDPVYHSAIVKREPGYQAAFIIVHEIGHLLGANHDGYYKVCPIEHNYIMAPHNTKTSMENIFYFSCCSMAEMFRTIKLNGDCLFFIGIDPDMEEVNETEWKETTEIFEPEVRNITAQRLALPGVVYDRVAQCQLVFDDSHVPCTQDMLPDVMAAIGLNECDILFCYDPNDSVCDYSEKTPVLPGTECGPGKWCIGGHCIHNNITDANIGKTCLFELLDMTLADHSTAEEEEGPMSMRSIIQMVSKYGAAAVGSVLFIVGTIFSLVKRRTQAKINLAKKGDKVNEAAYIRKNTIQAAKIVNMMESRYSIAQIDEQPKMDRRQTKRRGTTPTSDPVKIEALTRPDGSPEQSVTQSNNPDPAK